MKPESELELLYDNESPPARERGLKQEQLKETPQLSDVALLIN